MEPITNESQCIENIEKFNDELVSSTDHKLYDYLPYFRAWYAYKSQDGWLLAPSKYVGYAGMDRDKYIQHLDSLDGRTSESNLSRFSVAAEGKEKELLMEKVAELLSSFGKLPNKLLRVSVMRNSSVADEENSTIDAIVTMINSLPPYMSQAIKKRLR
ncbi:hypothetical protein [Pectobacterium versatile]|uniref:hypothetical protein n=1 Tax=Pectobacterium versatile TaxID=2488639 RepID=UPI001CCBA530|nr:hypothetical protein [Pectobacterium versatile]